MKTSIIIAVISAGLVVSGCSSSTYLNLSENNNEQVVETINNFQKEENVGAKLTLTLKDSTEITGELLSIRENTITICEYYSASNADLAELKYPVIVLNNDDIKVLVIEGSNNLGSGIAIGALAGAAFGAAFAALIVVSKQDDFDPGPASSYYLVMVPGGFVVGALFGAARGAGTSVEEIVLRDIPPRYDFSIMKPLARYPDEEPDYLKTIK